VAWPNQSPPGSNPSSTPEFTPPAIVALAAGIIMFLASILAWVKAGDTGFSAWTTEFGLFPVATFVPLAGLVTAGLVGARLFLKDKVPSEIIGFSLIQIQQILAVFTLLLALGYLIMDNGFLDMGFGYWLNVLGAIALVVAAVMEFMAPKPAGFAGGQPGYNPPPQQGYPQQQPPPQQQQPYPQQQQPQQPYPQQQPPRQQPPRPQPPQGGQQGYPPPPPQQGGSWPQQ
jgi:hypothetical protein